MFQQEHMMLRWSMEMVVQQLHQLLFHLLMQLILQAQLKQLAWEAQMEQQQL